MQNMMNQTLLSAQVLEAICFFDRQGWCPATSSNFSYRSPQNAEQLYISASGLSKGAMKASDFIPLSLTCGVPGGVLPEDEQRRPSAETLLHACVYQQYSSVQAVFHTHSVNSTVLSRHYEQSGEIVFENFEILKGLEGVKSHEGPIAIPVLSNSQNMEELATRLSALMFGEKGLWGFLLAGHGLYAWGNTPATARRHIEVFEFLFEAMIKGVLYGRSDHSR